jgi:aldehyde dehydrogenase (NAD+)
VPIGVAAAIVPWNFPLMNAVWKLAPALACGCAVVLKPSELTPLSALWIGQAGFGADAGAALVSHRNVDKISFTGSPATGRFIMRAAAENIARVSLELGGKSPSVVFADADLAAAARAITSGARSSMPGRFARRRRVLVQDTVYDAFVDRLVAQAAKLRSGDPLAAETVLGPVISEKQLERVLSYIDNGRAEGAHVAIGGGRISNRGYFIEPTIFVNVEANMRIWREEIFGPVLAVTRFSREEDAATLANGTDYSLAAAVWTRDLDRATRMTDALYAGTVWVNTYGPSDARLPWGGMGARSRRSAWADSPASGAISAEARSRTIPSRRRCGSDAPQPAENLDRLRRGWTPPPRARRKLPLPELPSGSTGRTGLN